MTAEHRRDLLSTYTQSLAVELHRQARLLDEVACVIEQAGAVTAEDVRAIARVGDRINALYSAANQVEDGDLTHALAFWRPGGK